MIYKEEWRHIDENKLYMVSNLGNVLMIEHRDKLGRLQKERYKKKYKRTNGYLFVQIKVDGKNKCFDIHRLVAKAFIPNPYNLPCINHKDENKENNNAYNLEWCDYSYNNSYGSGAKSRVKNHIKQVHRYDLNGNYIDTFDSAESANNYLGGKFSISACCRGVTKTAGGYRWSYERKEHL